MHQTNTRHSESLSLVLQNPYLPSSSASPLIMLRAGGKEWLSVVDQRLEIRVAALTFKKLSLNLAKLFSVCWLASSQGIHCGQARLLAEYAAALVQEDATRIASSGSNGYSHRLRENGFNLKLSIYGDRGDLYLKQRQLRFTYREHTEGIAQMHIALSGPRFRISPDG